MKILKNYDKSVYGIKKTFFTLIFNTKTNKYCYYVNAFSTKNMGDLMIYKGNKKCFYLNGFTMFFLSSLYSIYKYCIKYPVIGLITPIIMYADGCKNFVRNTAWYNNVRFFNWVNIISLISLLTYIILIK